MEFVRSQALDFSSVAPTPLESEQDDGEGYDEKRVWIGNLDPGLSEFVALKLLQSQGPLQKFDYVYHKEGSSLGKPRGFCFATYTTPEAAKKAINNLHQSSVNGRKLVVRIANPSRSREKRTAERFNCSQTSSAVCSKQAEIAALETKLSSMDSAETNNIHNNLVQSSLLTAKSQNLRKKIDELSTSTHNAGHRHSANSLHSTGHRHSTHPYSRKNMTQDTRSSMTISPNSKYKPCKR